MEVTEDQILFMLESKNQGNRSEFISLFNTINKFSKTFDGFIYFLSGLATFERKECIDFAFGIVRKWLLTTFSNIPNEFYPNLIQLLFNEIPKKEFFALLAYKFSVIKLQAVAIYHLTPEFPDFWIKLFQQNEFYVYDFLSSFSYIIIDYNELINNQPCNTKDIFDPDELEFKNGDKTIQIKNFLLTNGIENQILSYLLEKIVACTEFDQIFLNNEQILSETSKSSQCAAKLFILVSSWIDTSYLFSIEMLQLLSNLFQRQPTFVLDVLCVFFKHPIAYDAQIDILNAMNISEQIDAFDSNSKEILKKSERFHVSLSNFLKLVISNVIEHEVSQKYFNLAFNCFQFMNPVIYSNLKDFFSKAIQVYSVDLNEPLINVILTAMTAIIGLNATNGSVTNHHFLLIHCFSLLSSIEKFQGKSNSLAIYLIQLLSQFIVPNKEIDVQNFPQIATLLTAFYDFLDHEDHRGMNIVEILEFLKPIMMPNPEITNPIIFNSYCISVGIFSQIFIQFVIEVNQEEESDESYLDSFDQSLLEFIQLIFITCTNCLTSLFSNEIDSLALTNLEDSIVFIIHHFSILVLQIPSVNQFILSFINSSRCRLNSCASKLISQIESPELKIELYSKVLDHYRESLTTILKSEDSELILSEFKNIFAFVKKIDAFNYQPLVENLSDFLSNCITPLYENISNESIIEIFIEASFNSLHYFCLPFLIDIIQEHFSIRLFSIISIYDFYDYNEIIISIIQLLLENKQQILSEIHLGLFSRDLADSEEEREILLSFRKICSFLIDFILHLLLSLQENMALFEHCFMFLNECYSLGILKKNNIEKINQICLDILNESTKSVVWNFALSVFMNSLQIISLNQSKFIKYSKLSFEQSLSIMKKCLEIDPELIGELDKLLIQTQYSEPIILEIKSLVEIETRDCLSLYTLLK